MIILINQHKWCARLCACVALVLGLPSPSAAQNFWQQTSGPIGADVRALASTPSGAIFAGTIGNGAFRSRDAGATWAPVNNDSLDRIVLAFTQNTSGYLFAATLGGVFRSLNEGDNWARSNAGLTTLNIRGLAVNANEDIFAGTAAGVFRSLDNGASWTSQRSGLADTILVEDLAINKAGDIFAATFRNGVFRSTDNGNTWSQVNVGLTNLFVFALAINNSGDLFAGTNSGVFRSLDNGNTWTTTGLQIRLVRALAITAQGDIFAGLEGDGVFRSPDNGATWSSIVNTGLTNNVVNALGLDAQGFLYAGTRGSGVFRSVNSTIALLTRTFPDTATTVDGPVLMLNLDNYFDNGAGGLFYDALTSDSTKLFVQVESSANVLNLTPLTVGSAEVVIEAFDSFSGISANDTFNVTVTNAAQSPGLRKIYWADFFSSSIQRANSDGTQRETLAAALPNNPIDLAIDFGGGKMYWSENFNTGTTKIQRANLDGSVQEILVDLSGLIIVPSLALDIPNQKIYWAAIPTANGANQTARRLPGAIQRANFDGSNIETINSSVEFPVGLAVGGGKVYWYDDGSGWIARANLDGSAFEQIIEQPSQQAAPLAVDVAQGKIYWIADNFLRRANLDGSNNENLLYGAGEASDLTLDATQRKVYWFAGSGPSSGVMRRANYDGTHLETLPILNLAAVFGLAVGDPSLNLPPFVANEIPDVTLVATNPGFKLVLDLRNVFRDPEEDALSFTATSSNTAAASATITGNILTVAPVDSGVALITITADDGYGGIASTTFTARTVTSNTAPRVVANIADQVLTKGTPAFQRALRAHFGDADGDQILFGATSSKPQVATANIQFNSDTLEVAPIDTGRATIIVYASDGKGGQAADTFNVTVYISPPPVIAHSSVAQQNFNQAIALVAKITDNENAVKSATLYYREAGENNFVSLKMDTARVGVDTLRATAAIPNLAVGTSGVEYYLTATDKHGVPGRAPQFGVYSVRVQIGGEGIDRGSAQTSGTAQSGYRLFSIPLELDNKNVEAVLTDDLGAYDDRQWRWYDWASDANGNLTKVEFPNTPELAPGKAFWLIVRGSARKIDSGPGTTVSTASKFALNLRKGWNLISTPFNFAASAAPLLMHGDSLLFYAYENGWSAARRPSSRNKFAPFEGYAVFSDTATTMFILPNEFAAQNVALPKPESAAIFWSIHIAAQCQEARDANNLLAVMNSAARAWDKQDFPEPPPIGDYVSVYFPHEDWKRWSKNYCTDVRPEPRENEEWDFAIETNIRDEVRLSFEGITSVPSEYEVWLIDKAVHIAQDLRRNNHYSVAGRGPENPKLLTLVVNKSGRMKEEYEALRAVPASFELSQNFPNPFNPATTLRYALPQAEHVTLQVFNLLGELIATLVENEEKDAGYHVVLWSGRNAAGRAVGNGVYFVRMRAGEFVQTRKVVLVE